MKKKLLLLFLCGIMVLGITGCGNTKQDEDVTGGTSKPDTGVTDSSTSKPENDVDKEVVEIGKLDLELQYIDDFYEGLVVAKKGDKWGYLNKKGEVVIDFIYDHANKFSDGLAAVKKDGKYGYINKNGEVAIELKYERASTFSNGYGVFKDGIYFGAVDKNGTVIIPADKYYNVIPLANDLFIVDGLEAGAKDGGYAIIDATGKLLTTTSYANCNRTGQLGLIAVKQLLKDSQRPMEDGKWGYIDATGKLVIDYQYDVAYPFYGELALVEKDEKTGVINSKGDVVVAIQYPDSNNMVTTDFSQDGNGFMVIYDGNKTLYFDKTGKIQIETEAGVVGNDFCNGFSSVKKDGKYGYIDTTGKLVIDYQYAFTSNFLDGLAKVYKDSERTNFAFIDKDGNTVLAGNLVK